MNRLFFALILFAGLTGTAANAAIVGFLGEVVQGREGPVLGSLPRNFTLVLDYNPVPGGSTTINSGTLRFPATPNGSTSNTNVESAVVVPLDVSVGGLTVANNMGPMGEDLLNFTGRISAGLLGPNNVNFSFTFLKPGDTIDSVDLNPTSIGLLVTGQTSIAFSGGAGGFSGQGSIRGAPEPATMIALTGLVVGGCGVGLRRRIRKRRESAAA
ncbi:MAG: hypothetical protein AAF802_03210 [Planctomycetota bacterium]